MVTYYTLDPHPAVIAKWKEVNYLPDANRIPRAESQAFKMMGAGKVITLVDPISERQEFVCTMTVEDPQRPIKRQIHKLYRIKEKEGKEYFYFVHHLAGENFTGDKKVDCTQIVGRYMEPDFEKLKNRETGEITTRGHKEGKPTYEIVYTADRFTDPSTHEQTSLKELGKFVGEKAWYYVYVSGHKYELLDITYEQFINASYEDLVHFAVHRVWLNIKPVPTSEPQKRALKSE